MTIIDTLAEDATFVDEKTHTIDIDLADYLDRDIEFTVYSPTADPDVHPRVVYDECRDFSAENLRRWMDENPY